jgi:hypothetical protein
LIDVSYAFMVPPNQQRINDPILLQLFPN